MYNVLFLFVSSRGKVYLLYFGHPLTLSDHLISQWLEVPMVLLDDTLFSRPISTRLRYRGKVQRVAPVTSLQVPRYLTWGSGDNYLMRLGVLR